MSKGDRIKLAIQPQHSMPPKQPLLLDFEQDLMLSDIVKDVCGRWGVDHPELYAFMYVDSPGLSRKFGYVSEDNRFDLADGDILRLELTPKRLAEKMHGILSSSDPQKHIVYFDQLSSYARDPTFSGEFVKMNGMPILIGMVEKAAFHTDENVLRLNALLAIFEEIMEHNIVPWNAVTETFISKLISLVVHTRSQDLVRAPVLGRCFSILCSILANHQQYADLILRNMRLEQIILFLSNRSELVQQNLLAFVNGMLLTGRNVPAMFQQLRDQKYGKKIQSDVIEGRSGSAALSRKLSHQLYVYQQLLLNQYEDSMNKPFTKGVTEHEQALLYLQQAIPEEFSAGRPPSTLTPMSDQIWRQLGFSGQNPYSDLAEVPPGILALNCMHHFASTKRETFVRLLLSNKDNPCPFAQASIQLTKLLCQIFKVGEAPNDVAVGCLQPLVSSDLPFEELFSVTIQLLYKTWREMRAAEADFDKVMKVVEKQVTTVIHQSQSISSFEVLRQKLFELSYKKIVSASVEKGQMNTSIWKAQPVVQLKEAIVPEMKQLIKRQRLRHLVEGDFFPNVKIKSKKNQSSFYCRLSPNWKVIHFGDAEDTGQRPSLDALKSKIAVSDMRLVIGKDCPHVKDKSVKGKPELAFSIYYSGDEHLDFLTQDDVVFSIWVDGLSVLCGSDMPSRQADEELNTLLVMEMKLRLLDVEDIPIPSEPPTIPPDPPNYDFHYKLD